MEIIIWLLFCVGVGYYANTKGRNPVGWGALAFLISPLIAGIILALSKDLNTEKKIEEVNNKTDNLKTEMNFNQKFNDYRAEHMAAQIKSLDSSSKDQSKIITNNQRYQIDRKIKCNSCGGMVSYNSKFCPMCGKEIEKEKICSNCNQKYPVDSKFCPHCGAKAETNQICTNCGQKYEPGIKFCPNCGVQLTQA